MQKHFTNILRSDFVISSMLLKTTMFYVESLLVSQVPRISRYHCKYKRKLYPIDKYK